MTTERGTGKGKAATSPTNVVERMPFLLLGLDLPPAPLFKDTLEKNIIPQVRCNCTVGALGAPETRQSALLWSEDMLERDSIPQVRALRRVFQPPCNPDTVL